MATVPISGTSIRLMSGIPFNSDYKNTRWFDNRNQQTTYFDSRTTVHNMGGQNSFQRIEGRHYIKVNKSVDDLWGTNYLTFINRNKRFYAFVTNLEYVNDGLTHVFFEIDVLQTWLFDMDFKPSYVVREHRRLWNNDGSPVINTQDEGLSYGAEYDVVSTAPVRTMGAFKWLIIVSKTKLSDNEIDSNIVGTPQPLHYYGVPFRDNGNTANVYLERTNQGVANIIHPNDVLRAIYSMTSTVNDIVSVYVTDSIGVEHSFNSDTNTITFPDNSDIVSYTPLIEDGTSTGSVIHFRHVERFVPTYHQIYSDKYSSFREVEESKLLMYPYTVIVLTDFKGNVMEFKPEFINSNQIRLQIRGSLGTSSYVTVTIPEYNRLTGDGQTNITSMENALIANNPNDVPILNDMLSAFLQGNKNSLETQKSSILWNGFTGAIGNAIGAVSSATTGNAVGVASSGTNLVKGLGNTVLDIEAIQSKQQDISNIPPQISKMGGNAPFNYGNGFNGFYIMKKQIKPEYIKVLSDFFKMFGYKTNEVKVPNFHTRRNWNYVQTKSCNITGNFNNTDLQELKSIFDNGITLWHTNDVGNYNLNNGVI